jgi:hypothetical protein
MEEIKDEDYPRTLFRTWWRDCKPSPLDADEEVRIHDIYSSVLQNDIITTVVMFTSFSLLPCYSAVIHSPRCICNEYVMFSDRLNNIYNKLWSIYCKILVTQSSTINIGAATRHFQSAKWLNHLVLTRTI